MICYIKALVINLGEFPMLRRGTYVGSKTSGAGIELKMPLTDKEGIMTQQVHTVTRMRDTTLLSCKEQPNMFEREVIGFVFFDAETQRLLPVLRRRDGGSAKRDGTRR